MAWVLPFAGLHSVSAQTTGSPSAASAGAPYRVLRSIAGAAGHEDNSKFIMDDARSLFNAGKDSKAIYFEWEGPLGPHHFEGLWKSPEGKIVLISDFRYEAKSSHYSGYWTMLLSEGTPSGEWNLEARIDGEPAGNLSFVVTGSPVAHAAPPPQPLSLAALYRKAMDATVILEKLAPNGEAVEESTGFWIGAGQILTSFESIDGATCCSRLAEFGQPSPNRTGGLVESMAGLGRSESRGGFTSFLKTWREWSRECGGSLRISGMGTSRVEANGRVGDGHEFVSPSRCTVTRGLRREFEIHGRSVVR